MITLRAEITHRNNGFIKISYVWCLQSKYHFILRSIDSQKSFMQLNARYSKWMTKTVLEPEIISISRYGTKVIILETEFV